mgnify:CR=1 FL=1
MEIASVLCCNDFAAESSYYFIAAALFFGKYKGRKNRATGIDFGWQFYLFLRAIHEWENSKSKNKTIQVMFRRYASNEEACSHDYSEFKQLVITRVVLSLWSFVSHPKQPTTKDDTSKTYQLFLAVFVMNAKKANELIGGHGLAMWAMFGFLPTWLSVATKTFFQKLVDNCSSV